MTSCCAASARSARRPSAPRARRRAGAPRHCTKRSYRTILVFRLPMQRPDLTRRQALGLGAAAVAVGALRPSGALAARPASLFELDLADAEGVATAAGWRT